MNHFDFLKDKKILITGGTGHLGSSITHYLVNELDISPKNIRIFYLKNTPTKSLANIKDYSKFDFFPSNILNKSEVEQAVKDVDYVFQTVGNTTFDPRLKKIQWLINVEGTRNVMDACIKNENVQRICYTSTVNALGIPNPVGSIGDFQNSDPYANKPKLHTFNSPEETLEFVEKVHEGRLNKWWKKIGIGYFDSKLAAQELVLEYVKRYGIDIVSVLPGTMMGPYDYLISGGMYIISIYNNIMPGVLKGGMPFMHVMDSVEGHLLAMEKGRKGEKYIITGREKDCLYLKEMVKIIAEVIKEKEPERKVKIPKIVFPKSIAMIGAIFMELIGKLTHKPIALSRDAVKAGSLPTFYSYRKAKEELGYTPKRTFKESVYEAFDYFKINNLLSQKTRNADKLEVLKQ
ncbi:MAG: NAD-dependent epimerase/dehydratase family protein [Promethearchaeota archaeon]